MERELIAAAAGGAAAGAGSALTPTLWGLGGSKPLAGTRSHFVGARSHLARTLREVPRGLQTASYGARRLYATSCDCRRARLQWANLLDGHSHGLALPPHVQAFASGQRVRRMCA